MGRERQSAAAMQRHRQGRQTERGLGGQLGAHTFSRPSVKSCISAHTYDVYTADTSCIAQLVREIEDNLSWRDYRDKIKTLEDEMKDRGEELDQLPSKKVYWMRVASCTHALQSL
jgi:hypothetical protein